MLSKKILSALIGLAGAINNNGKTADTDEVIRKALLSDDDVQSVAQIHHEKYRISPNCETCSTPCGNTSDYPIEAFDSWSAETRELKEQIITALCCIAAEGKPLPDAVCTAIACLGYDLNPDTYKKLLKELSI